MREALDRYRRAGADIDPEMLLGISDMFVMEQDTSEAAIYPRGLVISANVRKSAFRRL